MVLLSIMSIPNWITFPKEDWISISPEEAGLDPKGFASWIASLDVKGASFGGETHSGNQFGTIITRGGYLIQSWGDRNYKFHTASVGKALCWALLGFAVEDGLVDPDEPINKIWTGEDQLSHPHKYLNRGYHSSLTWRHLIGFRWGDFHFGGFPIELGVRWAEKRTGLEDITTVDGVPSWSKWTGDPSYDLYSHTEPGTVGLYSSAGFWRLGQALTVLWNQDLKDVIDERMFSKIGIPSTQWDWYTGDFVKSQKFFYPDIPDSYTYLDPPYEINGVPIRSGPGWIVISASNLARFGHLLATRGNWNGEQIIDPNWIRGHGGGNKSGVSGENTYYTATGMVTTEGLEWSAGFNILVEPRESIIPKELFIAPVCIDR